MKGLAKRVVASGCRENLLKADIKNHLHPWPHLGHEFERKMTAARNEKLLSVDEEVSLRGRCINFVIALVSQLQLRLPDNVEILEKVSLLAPDNCLRAVKPSIIPLAELMCEPPDVITDAVRVCPLFHFLPPCGRGATAAVLTSYPFPSLPSLVSWWGAGPRRRFGSASYRELKRSSSCD